MTKNSSYSSEVIESDVSETYAVKAESSFESTTIGCHDDADSLTFFQSSNIEHQTQQQHQQEIIVADMNLLTIDENKTSEMSLHDDLNRYSDDDDERNEILCDNDHILKQPLHNTNSAMSTNKTHSILQQRPSLRPDNDISTSFRLSQIGLKTYPKSNNDNYEIGNSVNDFGSKSFDNSSEMFNVEEYDDDDVKEQCKKNGNRNMSFPKSIRNKNHSDSMKKTLSNHEIQEQRKNELEIAKREDKLIRTTKLIFIFVLIIIGIIVSISVYRYTRNDENNEFKIQFTNYGQLITNKLHINALSKIEAINTLAFYIQSYAIQNNQSWPYVTIPHFEEHVIAMKSLTDAFAVQIFPIVTNTTRSLWEEYSIQNNDWINASYQTQMGYFGKTNQRPILGQNGTSWFDELWGTEFDNPNMPNFEIGNGMSNAIFTTYHPDNSSKKDPYIDPNPNGPYFPQWQAAPMSWYYQTTVNSNYGNFDDFYNCSMISMTTYEACLGVAWTDYNAPGYITTMLYPIFDQFIYKYNTDLDSTSMTNTSTAQEKPPEEEGRNVVAFLGVDIYWESYLKRVLPPKTQKMHVVIHSTCDDSFTLEMIGEEVSFLGDGDLHEERYNDMYETTRFGKELYKNALKEKNQNVNIDVASRSTYIGQSLYDGFCQYDFTVYPSNEFENSYMTNQPMIYTISVALLFVFTIIVFIGYDWLVEKRQKIVLKSARLSDSIVSSLFPKNVKQQLYTERSNEETFMKDNNNNMDHRGGPSGVLDKMKNGITMRQRKLSVLTGHSSGITLQSSFYKSGEMNMNESDDLRDSIDNNKYRSNLQNKDMTILTDTDQLPQSSNTDTKTIDIKAKVTQLNGSGLDLSKHSQTSKHNQRLSLDMSKNSQTTNSEALRNSSNSFVKVDSIDKKGNKVIAELHPDATVMFADIVGFTSWCSGREPSDVFFLLETIYGAFDKIAVRRQVFKIETIGDCYVAVTGLPNPQPDHVERMVKFAHEMLTQLKKVLEETISPAMGSDSNKLAMRVGLNSGSVIAGVLRGDRARFQLFGDTMNTAARMESNGQRNCIHVSQNTADILTTKGKKHWLTRRPDMIEAKGKGKLQTYWVKMRRRTTARSRISSSTQAFRTSGTSDLATADLSAWSMSASRNDLELDASDSNLLDRDYEINNELDPTEEGIEEEEEFDDQDEKERITEVDSTIDIISPQSVSSRAESSRSFTSEEIVFVYDEPVQ